MVYESLSSVLLVLIAAILVLGWLPGKTSRGMKRASRHQQDRMSTSLHLVDENKTIRFGDVEPHRVKGLVMQPHEDGSRTQQEEKRIKQIRMMRRAAVRRRRFLVATLCIVSICLVALSYVFAFSAWYCLIPLTLVAFVLMSGARASAEAREWERHIAERQRKRQRPLIVPPQSATVRLSHDNGKEQTTTALSQEDIRAAVMLAQQLQHTARPSVEPVAHVDVTKSPYAPVQHEQPVQEKSSQELVMQTARADTVAAVNSQTLLSFSMGQPRHGQPVKPEEILSREIKSAKQVARAVPRVTSEEKAQVESKPALTSKGSASKPADFHKKEVQAEVDAPEASDDSLGKVGVEAILARRTQKNSQTA